MANTLRFKRGLVSGIPTAALGEPLFTTDTFDLYIGNGTGNTRFQKYIASGTTSQLLRGDGSLLTMPIVLTSPSNGQVLKYNGTSWVNDSDSGITGSGSAGQVAYFTGATTQSGSNNLFWDNTNGRLGININVPTHPLHVFTSVADVGILLDSNTNPSFIIRRSGVERLKLTATGLIGTINGLGNGLVFQTDSTERMRLTVAGNLHVGTFVSDNGLRFQVTGDGYFSGSVGIGSTSISNVNLRLSKTITGSATSHAVFQEGVVQTDVTTTAYGFRNIINTANSLTLGEYIHFYVQQGTIGTSNAITNQYGYSVGSNLTSATNNYGFYGNIASGTGRWNLYMNGTAANYLAGDLRVGTSTALYSAAGRGVVNINGTSTAILSLNINSNTNTGGYLYYDGTTINLLNSTSGGSLLFSTANTERMRLDASGNLGLGVTPNTWNSPFKVIQIGASSSLWNISGVTGSSNNHYNDLANRYIANGFATIFQHWNGQFAWLIAPNNTSGAGAAATFTQAMTLDASGRLGIGTTSPDSRLHVVDGFGNSIRVGFQGGTNNFNLYDANIHAFRNNNGTTEYVRIFSDGNVLLNSTGVNAGYKLDVNGTMRVSGASTFGGNLGVTLSQNSTTWIAVSNPDTDTTTFGTQAGFRVFVAGLHIGSLKATSRNLTGLSRRSLYLTTEGLYDLAFGVNQSATPSFVIDGSTGAATFSSSVTATSFNGTTNNIFSVNGTERMRLDASGDLGLNIAPSAWGGIEGGAIETKAGTTLYSYGTDNFNLGHNVLYNGTGGFSDKYIRDGFATKYYQVNGIHAWYSAPSGTAGNAITFTEVMRVSTTGLGLGITPSYKLDVTGEARVSNAIAIGTTPDTNKPFKILKNINGTVGINFENTSTGSLAFSAIQMGTDVSGGTKFTNLVYASSGVTASGVYNPDGTSLINNGSGGLNFLGNPIRMYTGGSNGVLRWDLVNDGYITHYNATNPSASATDGYRQYSADVTAGNAAPHFRTENGAVIKLYQETTGVGNAIFSQGGGNSVLDDSTFDGYTLRQIVKALRNQGILA